MICDVLRTVLNSFEDCFEDCFETFPMPGAEGCLSVTQQAAWEQATRGHSWRLANMKTIEQLVTMPWKTSLLHFNTWKNVKKEMLTQLILEQLMDVLLCSARDSPFHSSCWQYPLTYISCVQPIFPQCVEQRVEQCETNLGPSRAISG